MSVFIISISHGRRAGKEKMSVLTKNFAFARHLRRASLGRHQSIQSFQRPILVESWAVAELR
jgi:hypothetical protein